MAYKLKKFEDITYKITPDGVSLALDLYTPDPVPEEPMPCALFFHGGGWREGSKRDLWGFPLIIDELLPRGIAVASASYRLYGVNGGKFPDSIEDCLDALIFLDKMDNPRINPARKGVFGISAGGYCALMCAFYQHIADKHTDICVIADMCGPVYMQQSKIESVVHTPPTTAGFIRDFMAGKDFGANCNAVDIMQDSSQRPSLLIVHGESDECVDPEGSRILYKKARSLGLYTEYIEVENSLHTFSTSNGKPIRPKAQELFKYIGEFIAENI